MKRNIFLTLSFVFAFVVVFLAKTHAMPEVFSALSLDMSHGVAAMGLGLGAMLGEIKVLNLPHLDADESIFFARELEYVKGRSYDKKYAELKARRMIPVSSEADPWADAIVYETYDQVGMAKLISGYADDLPRADVKGTEVINKVKSLGASYGYNIMEIRKSKATGKNLEQRKANAAKRAILQKENSLAFLGDSKVGFAGLLNHPNVPECVVVADNSDGGSTEWLDTDGITALKTPAQILRDLHAMVTAVLVQTKDVEKPNCIALPLTRYRHISTTPFSSGDSGGKTILQMFLEQSEEIKVVERLNELETAADGGGCRALCYRRDPEALTLEIPQDFEQFDPQPRNLEFVVPCHSRFGGVIWYYPLSAVYADDI